MIAQRAAAGRRDGSSLLISTASRRPTDRRHHQQNCVSLERARLKTDCRRPLAIDLRAPADCDVISHVKRRRDDNVVTGYLPPPPVTSASL